MMKQRPRAFLEFLLLCLPYGVSFVFIFLYVFTIPLWQGNDEVGHFAYIQYVAEHWRLPRVDSFVSQEVVETLKYSPISSYVANVFGGWNEQSVFTSFEQYASLSGRDRAGREDALARIPSSFAREDGNDNELYRDGRVPKESQLFYIRDHILLSDHGKIRTAIWEAQQQPLYYALGAGVYQLFRFLSIKSLVLALRMFTALLFLPTLFFVYRFFRLMTDRWFALGTALFVAFIPQLLIVVTHISNDALAITLGSGCFYFIARGIFAKSGENSSLLFASLFALAGSVTKLPLLTLFLPIGIAAWFVARKKHLEALCLVAILLAFFTSLLFVFLRNISMGNAVGLYGKTVSLDTYVSFAKRVNLGTLLHFVYADFVGNLGLMNETYPRSIQYAFDLVTSVAITGAIWFVMATWRRRLRERENSVSLLVLIVCSWIVLAAVAALIYAANLYYFVEGGFTTYVFYGGWYFWPLLLPMLFFVVYPLYALQKNPSRSYLWMFGIIFFASLLNSWTLMKLREVYSVLHLI